VGSSRLPSTEDAPSNWAWLKVLKVSKRNSSDVDSVIWVALCRAKSELLIPGPYKIRREELPNVPSEFGLKSLVLKASGLLRGLCD
jgi:hypothetical protein